MENYKKVKLKAETLPYFKDCFESNNLFKTTEQLQWQYFSKSLGKSNSSIIIDEDEDKAIAVAATVVNQFKIGNLESKATQGLDLLVDKDYRNKGLFVEIGKNLQTDAIEDDQGLIYSFPNSNSVHGIRKYLGWELLGAAPFLIKPLKTQFFTERIKALRFLPNIKIPLGIKLHPKSIIISEKKEFPVEVNTVWKRFSKNIKVSLIRDQNYLNWRYLEKPNEEYTILHAHGKNGQYLGYAVYCVTKKHNGCIGYIMELVYDLDHKKAGSALLYEACKKIKKIGADCILSWCLDHSPNFKTYRKRGFLKIPKKLRPIEIYFAVFATFKKFEDLVEKRENWYLSYSDSDTV